MSLVEIMLCFWHVDFHLSQDHILKRQFFPCLIVLEPLLKIIEVKDKDKFLYTQFYSIDLYACQCASAILDYHSYIVSWNVWIFHSCASFQRLFGLFWVPCNSIWILESACQFLFSFKSRCNWHTLYQFQVYNTVIVYIVKQSPQ